MRINCDQCNALAINGTPTHEIGCPKSDWCWHYDSKAEEVYPALDDDFGFPEDELPPTKCYDYEDSGAVI